MISYVFQKKETLFCVPELPVLLLRLYEIISIVTQKVCLKFQQAFLKKVREVRALSLYLRSHRRSLRGEARKKGAVPELLVMLLRRAS